MEPINLKTAVTLVCLGFILIAVSIPVYLGKIKNELLLRLSHSEGV